MTLTVKWDSHIKKCQMSEITKKKLHTATNPLNSNEMKGENQNEIKQKKTEEGEEEAETEQDIIKTQRDRRRRQQRKKGRTHI